MLKTSHIIVWSRQYSVLISIGVLVHFLLLTSLLYPNIMLFYNKRHYFNPWSSRTCKIGLPAPPPPPPHDPPKPFFRKIPWYFWRLNMSPPKLPLRKWFYGPFSKWPPTTMECIVFNFNYHREANLVSKLIFSRSSWPIVPFFQVLMANLFFFKMAATKIQYNI